MAKEFDIITSKKNILQLCNELVNKGADIYCKSPRVVIKIKSTVKNNLSELVIKEKDPHKILNFIKENKIPFPIKELCCPISLIDMYERVKIFVENSDERWNYDKYFIQRIILDRTYKFNFPIFTKNILKFEEPTYLLFETQSSDYQDYNVLTDYFIEKSRIKSFIKTYDNKNYSPYLAWENSDDYKLRAIKRLINNNEIMNLSNLRESLYKDKIIKEVSHEKIIFLSNVMKIFGKNLKIFDACAGWGDRFISAMVVGAKMYIGVEPNNDSVECFKKMNSVLNGDNKKFKILHDYMPQAKLPSYVTKNYFDICFLSPPSFDSENYGDSEGQSILMFPERETWKKEFLEKTVHRCWSLIKNGGYFIVQSIIIKEIIPMIENTFKDAIYLGAISVTGEKDRVKPLWIWMKYADKYDSINLQEIKNPDITIITDSKSYFIDNIDVFPWKNSPKNSSYYLTYKPTDYFYNPNLFIKTLEQLQGKLFNPLKTIKWNLYKDYLIELKKRGVFIIPTKIVKKLHPNIFNSVYIIIKPLIGGGSYNVLQFKTPKNNKDCDSIEKIIFNKNEKMKYPLRRNQDFIVQPYLEHKNEFSLIYYYDGFSHCVKKEKTGIISNFKNRKITKCRVDNNLINLGYNILKNQTKNIYSPE